MFRLTITIDGVNRFVTDPDHEARAEGWMENRRLGGRLAVEQGIFNLFTHDVDPARKHMFYRLFFRDKEGNPFTLSGRKDIEDDPGLDLWADTTTLFVRIYKGHVRADEEAEAEVYASGILRILLQDFLKQLTTFRTEGPTLHDRVAALSRFGRFFFSKLWEVYGRRFIEYGP